MCLLIGCAAAMITCGMTRAIPPALFAPAPTAPTGAATIIAAALAALALGLTLPRQLIGSLIAESWRGLIGEPTRRRSPILLGTRRTHRPLYWITLSVIALTCGVSVALSPVLLRAVAAINASLHAAFVWSDLPLAILRGLLSLTAMLLPLGALGLCISCLHHLSCEQSLWNPRATGWTVLGAAGGAAIAAALAASGASASLTIVAASLPALLVSILAAWQSAAPPPQHDAGANDATIPEAVDREPKLLRSSIFLAGGAGAATLVATAASFQSARAVLVALAALGTGMLAGTKARPPGIRSLGGFGVACAFAGITVAIAAAFANSPPQTETLGEATRGVLAPALVALAAAAIGFATAYGRQSLLSRVGDRSAAGAGMLTRTLLCCAATVWIAAPLAVSALGPVAALVIVSLSLLVLAGLLVAFDRAESPRTRHRRTAFVLATLLAMIALAESPANPWHSPRESRTPHTETAAAEASPAISAPPPRS